MSNQMSGQDTGDDLDLSYLSDVACGSVEFMIEMIDIFLEQTPVYFDQISEAIQENNWKTVADLAHKIKPTLAFMGVEKAKDDMQIIEQKARTLEDTDSIESEFIVIKAVCTSLFLKLEIYKNNLEKQL